MNWGRGFKRLYTAITVAWIVGVFLRVFIYNSVPPWLSDWSVVRVTPNDSSPLSIFSGWSADVWIWAAGLSLVPPLILWGVLFHMAPWIYRGFKPSRP
jgi:hypothetical protein